MSALLGGATVSASLAAHAAAPVSVRRTAPPERFAYVAIERTLRLPAGHRRGSFGFRIDADYADEVVLTVTRGARVSVTAMSADGKMGVGESTRPWTTGCRHAGAFDVCAQGEEWCGLVNGRWRATVVKRSVAPAVVRVRLVFARRERAGTSAGV